MRYIFLSLILFSHSLVVFSQTGTTLVHGIVTDPNGAVIPKAKVTANLLAEKKINEAELFETITNDYGEFKFNNLPSGEYKLSVSVVGFGSETERRISVPQDKSIEIKIEIELGLGCDTLIEDAGVVSDKDKTEILKLAVADALSTKSGLLMSEQRNKTIIVSAENIKSEWLKDVNNLKFKLLSHSQIQEKADREGDFLFISIPYFKIRGLCVALEVSNTWAVGKNSRTVYLSGGGYRYEFRKENDKWIMKPIGGWVS